MKRLRNLVVGASIAALAALGVGVEGASAATIIKKVICTSGCATSPFSYGPFGPGAIGVLQGILHASKKNTYDWTFTLTGVDVNMEMQAGAGSPFTPLPIQFSLFSGTPGGAHSLLETSLFVTGATLTADGLGAGTYFMQLAPSGIFKGGEQVDGSVSVNLGVPEPATWLMMISGLALMGAGLRMRGRETSPAFA